MNLRLFPRVISIVTIAMALIIIFAVPTNAQQSSNFTSTVNKESNMFRLPVKSSNNYLEVTALSVGAALITFPNEDDSEIVKGFKYLIDDDTLGFIGVIENYYSPRGTIKSAAIMVAITKENGYLEVSYEVFKDEVVYEEGSFPLSGVKFYNALTKEKGSIFSTSSPQIAYDALLKWADKHVTKYRE